MVEYTEKQKKIAEELLEEPKTVEELRKELELNAKQLQEELKKMINLGVVKRKEDKYKLIEFIEQQMGKGPKLEGDYVIRLVIEASGKQPEAVEKEMDKLEESLKQEPYKILDYERAETQTEELEDEDEEKSASTFIETKVTVPEFTDVLYLVMNYGPSSVEVLEPEKMELTMNELQGALNDLASAVQYYTGLVIQLRKKLTETQRNKSMRMPPGSNLAQGKKALKDLYPGSEKSE